MLKKFLVLISLFLFSSSFIYGANCYSSASLQNEATINIVNSKDALIAIPSSLTLENNKIVTDIKNNTNEKIWVNVESGTIVPTENKAECKVNQEFGMPVEAGEKISVRLNLNNLKDVSEVIFRARWHDNNYSAEIRSSIIKESSIH